MASIPRIFARAGRRKSASITMTFSPCRAQVNARFVTTNDLPSEGVVLVKSIAFAFLLSALTLSVEWRERKASVVARSALEAATCAFSEELSLLILGMTPSKGSPITDSTSYALFARSSKNAMRNAMPMPPMIPAKMPSMILRT